MDASLLNSLWAINTELLLLISALLLLLYGAVRGEDACETILYSTMLVFAICLVGVFTTEPVSGLHYFDGLVRVDVFTQYSKGLVFLGAILTSVLSLDWLKRPATRRFEYPILMMLSVVGMCFMVSAQNFMTLYMGVELASLSLYVMAAFDRDNKRSSEAGLKYFVLGALGSCMLLFGISLVYGFAGSVDFVALGDLLETQERFSPGLVIGLVFVLVAICFKISAVPFHMWTPDVYQGAPTPVTAFFAVVPKIAAIAMLLRLLHHPFEALIIEWQQIIIFVSIASMLVGALGAMMQTNIKRLLAYSSIGHVGYLLVAVAAGSESGAQAMFVYFILYIFMSVGMFAFVLLMKRKGKQIEDISELAGLSKTCPMAALFVSIMMFSMAGIPPLAGFFGKMMIFLAAIESGLFVLAVIGVLTSVIGAFYYIKIVKIMYFDEEQPAFDSEVSIAMRAVLIVCAVVTCFFFLLPTPVMEVALRASLALH